MEANPKYCERLGRTNRCIELKAVASAEFRKGQGEWDTEWLVRGGFKCFFSHCHHRAPMSL